MNRKKGTILLYSILVIGALLLFAFLYSTLFTGEADIGKKADQTAAAAAAASAGIDDALHQLNASSTWSGESNVYLQNRNASYTISFNSGQTLIPYSTNNLAGSGAVTAYDGRKVPAGAAYIVSVGSSNGSTHLEHAFIGPTGNNNPFTNGALFSENGSIKLQGNPLIGYGPMYSQPETCLGGTQTLVGTEYGSIDIIGNKTSVLGNIGVDNTNQLSYNPSNYTPQCGVNTNPSSVSLPLGISPKSPYQTLTSITSTTTLTSGNYVVTGNISLTGNSQLIIKPGPVTIYAEGNISLGGGTLLNQSGNPPNPLNLTIYDIAPKGDSITISGSSGAYLELYSEYADVTIQGDAGNKQNNQLVGSIVTDYGTITVKGNPSIYYDTYLEGSGSSGNGNAKMAILSRW